MWQIWVLTMFLLFTQQNLCLGDSNENSKNAVVTNYEFYKGISNDYKFSFDTSDGISRKEIGESDSNDSLAVHGDVSWIAQDGSVYEMFFKADKRGFRPVIKRVSGP